MCTSNVCWSSKNLLRKLILISSSSCSNVTQDSRTAHIVEMYIGIGWCFSLYRCFLLSSCRNDTILCMNIFVFFSVTLLPYFCENLVINFLFLSQRNSQWLSAIEILESIFHIEFGSTWFDLENRLTCPSLLENLWELANGYNEYFLTAFIPNKIHLVWISSLNRIPCGRKESSDYFKKLRFENQISSGCMTWVGLDMKRFESNVSIKWAHHWKHTQLKLKSERLC